MVLLKADFVAVSETPEAVFGPRNGQEAMLPTK
jgi:hypothetical protein